jgi:preprotein translocase subunit SecD
MESLRSRWVVLILSIVAAILFLVPTFLPERFQEKGSWISRPLSLGLDLSGGVHLVYQVEAGEAVKSRLQTKANTILADLREMKIPVIRAAANTNGELEVVLASARRVDDAKAKITDTHRDIEFRQAIPEGERVRLVYGVSEVVQRRIESEAINQAIETLRNRVDQFGVAEPLIQKVGTDRIMLQMPGVQDIVAVKRVVGSVAKLEFRLLPSAGSGSSNVTLKSRSGEPVVVEDQALMTGDAVENARVSIETGQVEVILNLNTDGARAFRKLTTENVGRSLAIVLDNVVYSYPTIREPILQGTASISGGFTVDEASQLAIVLNAGALPAPLTAIEERTVGPTLGAESIRKGIVAILVGFSAILIFMIAYYKKAGVVAVSTLALNGLLLIGCLSAFGATLTLPGLAGLALTIGMAVDSNVIIFERIRDELRRGAGRDAAVRGGFDQAWSAIIDANLTTLLSAIILYFLGSGPIRGFAVALAVGILTTIFCAIFVSRLLFDTLPLRGQKELSI